MSGHSYARRAVLRGAAGAGALGLVAAAGAGSVAAASAAPATPEQDHAPAANDTPVVVYLRDASSGELEIFAGTRQTRIHDAALTARLTRAIHVR
jgi:hypothetical protein